MSFDVLPLGDVLSEKGYIRGPFGSALKRQELKQSGIPVYEQQQAIDGHRRFRFFVDQEKYEELRRFTVKANDLIISCSGTVGRVSVIAEGDPIGIISQALLILRPDVEKLLPRFLYYFLTSPAGQASLLAASHGAVQQNIAPRAVVEKILTPMPGIEDQRAIISVLGSLDDRITLLRETNATLEAIAQALFKSWFVDFDPVRAKMAGRAPEGMDEVTAAMFPDALEETELGVVPKGWHIGALDSIAALNPESWSSKHHPDRLLYVDLANTKENQIEGITEFAFDEAPSRARRVLRQGDVIVGTVRPGNRSFARISVDRAGLTGSTGFAVLRAHLHSDQALVYIAVTRDEAIERLAHLADGGAYPAVRPEVVASTPVVIAPESVRQAFGEVANHLLASVGSNQEQSRYLADLRDTLLPRLISGQLRLPEAQAQLEAIA